MPPPLKPVYLLTGSDRPKIERALRRLRERIGEESVERLSAAAVSGDDVVAACNTLGFLGGEGRLVIVDEANRWKAADVRALAAYLDDPAPDTVLALVAVELKADAPLVKLCAKAGDVLTYAVPKRKLPEWVGEQFARAGATAEPDACERLVEVVGDDVSALANEIDKLATWAGEDPIREADVGALATGFAELPVFALTDAWGRRNVAATLAAAETILDRSTDNRSRTLARLVASIASHVGRVRAAQVLAAEGVRPRDAAPRLGVHPFAAEKAFGHAANFAADELQAATVRLSELDLALKGASRLAGELELERALVDITRPRAAAASALAERGS